VKWGVILSGVRRNVVRSTGPQNYSTRPGKGGGGAQSNKEKKTIERKKKPCNNEQKKTGASAVKVA